MAPAESPVSVPTEVPSVKSRQNEFVKKNLGSRRTEYRDREHSRAKPGVLRVTFKISNYHKNKYIIIINTNTFKLFI